MAKRIVNGVQDLVYIRIWVKDMVPMIKHLDDERIGLLFKEILEYVQSGEINNSVSPDIASVYFYQIEKVNHDLEDTKKRSEIASANAKCRWKEKDTNLEIDKNYNDLIDKLVEIRKSNWKGRDSFDKTATVSQIENAIQKFNKEEQETILNIAIRRQGNWNQAIKEFQKSTF
ncbi:unknown [Firmicutes bacterium CAG:308]|nr:unknown [Firmicutes bacterium CAG:308]